MDGKVHRIGRHEVLLPLDHRLDSYQRDWPRYDTVLGEIAQEVRRAHPDATAIDVGANVGDTAALLCAHGDLPVLAVEGNEQFLPYLRENAERIGAHIEIFEGYVGPEDMTIDASHVRTVGGTATVVSAIGLDDAGLKPASLAEIVASRPGFADARLLKIDTDGFDFDIIVSSAGFLANAVPVVFFEYDTGFRPQDEQGSLDAIGQLMSIGYDRFVVWDNFGHFLLTTTSAETFVELNAFLRSNRDDGTAVYYLDVAAFHERDRDVFEAVRARELSR